MSEQSPTMDGSMANMDNVSTGAEDTYEELLRENRSPDFEIQKWIDEYDDPATKIRRTSDLLELKSAGLAKFEMKAVITCEKFGLIPRQPSHRTMESNRSNRTNNDEPNAKRPKLESAASTSSKPKMEDRFLLLPHDLLAILLINNIHVAQWPSLESLESVRPSVLIAWRQLRRINLDRELSYERDDNEETGSSIKKSVELILRKLVERSPFLEKIDIPDASLTTDGVRLLAKFEQLESITIGDPTAYDDATCYDDRPGLPLEDVIELLETTRSRTDLKELRLFNVDQRRPEHNPATILDQFASSFVSGREIRSPLRLEKFAFYWPYVWTERTFYLRLDTMDTSRLTDVRVRAARVEPDQLANLIDRASNLRVLQFAFGDCSDDCAGPRLQANKNLLTALASHDNLSSIKFDGWYDGDCVCVNFQPEFIEMLKAIGRRGQLRKLALEKYIGDSLWINMEEICATICEFLPYLQSIRLFTNCETNVLQQEDISSIVGLSKLEEIDFQNYCPVTTNIIEKIAQLPRLKRLALDLSDEHDWLQRLADVKTLTDIRINHADGISGDTFVKWSEGGFVSNLQVLTLSWTRTMGVEEGLVRLLEKANRLRVLLLNVNQNAQSAAGKPYPTITDRSLIAIAKSCPKLEIFGVRADSKKITVQCLQEIVNRCPKLRKLGEFEDEIREEIQFPKYRKIGDIDVISHFVVYDYFDDDEYD